MTDRIDTAALRRAHQATTQGVWEWDAGIIPPDGPGKYADIYVLDEDREPIVLAEFNDSLKEGRANARFIALAHEQWPALLDRIDALEAFAKACAQRDDSIGDDARTALGDSS